MKQLAPIQLDDDTVIYIEAEDDIVPPSDNSSSSENYSEGVTRSAKGIGSNSQRSALHRFQAMQGTIRTYTAYTLNAFREVGNANIDKVTLEFGIKIAGEAGIPYVTKGTAESNLKITVECSFPKD